MIKSKVAVMQCESYNLNMLKQKINAAIDELGGWDQWLNPGMNVLLKANLISPLPPESAAVTHCEFVRAIVQILKQLGCNVWIGDSSGGAIGGKSQTGKSFSVSGIEQMAIDEGAVIKNFDTEGVVELKDSFGKKMYLAKPMFEADFVINMPKFKSHLATIYTGAYKNLFGCIPGLKKADYHKEAFDMAAFGNIICDINKSVKVGLNIMDGIIAMDKLGPVSGGVYKAHKILASTDTLSLDAAALKMIGLNISELPIFKAAVEQNIGIWNTEDIEICGDFQSCPRLNGFKLPKTISKAAGKNKMTGRFINLMKTRPLIIQSKCKHCNVCVDSCPVQAIDKTSKFIDYDTCIECMCCHELCIHKAVDLVRMNPVLRLFSRNR